MEPEKEWNLGIRDIDGVEHFSYPAAISIFVYRAGSLGEKDVCSCADAAAVRNSGLHIWLYVHKDECGISYSWFRQADVKKGAHKQQAVLSEHLIYQKYHGEASNGPPMRRCTRAQGTLPDAKDEEGLDDLWTLSQPTELCASRLRCRQCGLHQKLQHFSQARDGTQPRIDTSGVLQEDLEMGKEFEEFSTVWCNFCLTKFSHAPCANTIVLPKCTRSPRGTTDGNEEPPALSVKPRSTLCVRNVGMSCTSQSSNASNVAIQRCSSSFPDRHGTTSHTRN